MESKIRKNKYTRMKDFITKTGLSRKTIERAESGQYKISDNSIKENAVIKSTIEYFEKNGDKLSGKSSKEILENIVKFVIMSL